MEPASWERDGVTINVSGDSRVAAVTFAYQATLFLAARAIARRRAVKITRVRRY